MTEEREMPCGRTQATFAGLEEGSRVSWIKEDVASRGWELAERNAASAAAGP